MLSPSSVAEDQGAGKEAANLSGRTNWIFGEGALDFLPLAVAEREAVHGLFVAIELIFVAFWIERGNGDLAAQCQRLLHWLAAHRDAVQIASTNQLSKEAG